MSELLETIKEELKDKETRVIYDDDLLNTYVATQIKVLREQRGWTQQQLAEQAGMKQERISVMEDVNYAAWTAKVLKRLAEAFDVRLTIKFEEFNTYLKDFQDIKRKSLEKLSFENDSAFVDKTEQSQTDSNVIDINDWKVGHARNAISTTGEAEMVASTAKIIPEQSQLTSKGLPVTSQVASAATTMPEQPPLFLDRPRKTAQRRKRRLAYTAIKRMPAGHRRQVA